MSILILLAQCVTMFLASVLAGSLPLMFKSALSGESYVPLYNSTPAHAST